MEGYYVTAVVTRPMITERIVNEIKRGEVVKTKKYSYWLDYNNGNICRTERAKENTTECKIEVVGKI